MIYLGSDHAGYNLKAAIAGYLKDAKIEYQDCGVDSADLEADYPDFAFDVGQKVAQSRAMGILICDSGIGMSIAANKVKGIRAALVDDEQSAQRSRQHNSANILCLSARNLDKSQAIKIIKIWLSTDFSKDMRHQRRVNKIIQFEKNGKKG